jgi:tetratricopeptide (TPR) repeat protein
MNEGVTPVEIFCCYAHEDEEWRRKLEKHLNLLKRQGLIALWHDRLIIAGTDWAETIDAHLETASIVLLLVSADFFASDYCYGIEMKRAMERQATGEAVVIPIIVRPADWHSAPFAHLQVLPTAAKPLSTWPDEESGLTDVAVGIRKALEEAAQLSAGAPRVGLPPIWNIPYSRNPFFLGRDTELKQIHQFLQAGLVTELAQPQAINGLGGIGKTQLALEYAYRYHSDYQVVLWAHAESVETLISSYIIIAGLLRLPEREAREQDLTVQAVKMWLQTHRNWLLILDNADELRLLEGFLPPTLGGHLILTTRAAATGKLAHRLEIETLLPEQAALFLLRRAKLVTRDAELEQTSVQERALALQIAEELGRLPLALDQAGAYIEETRIDLAGYWDIYQQHRADLLRERRGLENDHPAPVATTWSVAFQRVEEKNPAAAELLRLFAYLAPDAIPEELLRDGAAALGAILAPVAANAFLLNQAIEALNAYSLIWRDWRGKIFSVHRLVQAVVQDSLQDAQIHLWVERAMLAVNAAFPHVEHSTRPQCESLLPQALMITQFIERYQIFNEEAGHLFYVTAYYLQDRGRYAEAEPLLLRALHIWEQRLGPEHSSVLDACYSRASLYKHQGKYDQAEALYKQTLRISEQRLGSEHPDMINPLHSLASLYREQGKFSEAEPLFLRVLHIGEQQLGFEHPSVAGSLNSLATLYYQHGKYTEAELLYERALRIREKQLGLEHPEVAYTLNGLAALSRRRKEYALSEMLYERALHIWKLQSGIEHPNMAHPLNGLALLCREQDKYAEAERLFLRALGIRKPQLGPDHPYVAYSLHGLATLYHKQGKYIEAEERYKRALDIWKEALLLEHPAAAEIMYDLARLYEEQANSNEAKIWYTRALTISEQAFGVHHPKTMETRKRLIAILHAIGEHEEAAKLEAVQLEP